MTWKCVATWKRFQLKRFNLIFKRQLLGPKKVGRANRNGLRLVEMNPKFKNSCQDLVCIKGDIIQINLGVQTCHKFLLFTTNHCFAKLNTISPNMGYGIESAQSFDTNGHPMCFGPVLKVLVIVCCHNHVCYDVQHQFQHKWNYANTWFDCFWILFA